MAYQEHVGNNVIETCSTSSPASVYNSRHNIAGGTYATGIKAINLVGACLVCWAREYGPYNMLLAELLLSSYKFAVYLSCHFYHIQMIAEYLL